MKHSPRFKASRRALSALCSLDFELLPSTWIFTSKLILMESLKIVRKLLPCRIFTWHSGLPKKALAHASTAIRVNGNHSREQSSKQQFFSVSFHSSLCSIVENFFPSAQPLSTMIVRCGNYYHMMTSQNWKTLSVLKFAHRRRFFARSPERRWSLMARMLQITWLWESHRSASVSL